MMWSLSAEERIFAALQRTDLLPEQGPIIQRIRRLGIPWVSYEKFVEKAVTENPASIDSKFWAIMEKEAAAILPHIPAHSRRIVDIGAGLAGVDLVLSRTISFDQIVLVDRTLKDRKVYYGFEEKAAFYNSLESARGLLIRYGVRPESIQIVDAPGDGVIPCPAGSVDVVISTISWGFHYPVSVYLESVTRILAENGVLIIDLRKGSSGFEDLLPYFHVEIISRDKKSFRVVASKR